jgi:cell division protein FtsL
MKKRWAEFRARVGHRYRVFKKQARARWDAMPTFGTARIALLALAMFILVALIYLAQSSNAALTARELRVKQLKIAEVERENAQLRYEIAALASPSAIEQRAHKLGLGPAKRVVYAEMPWIQPEPNELMPAFLPEGQVVTTPQTFESSADTIQELLRLLGLESLSERANAQGE